MYFADADLICNGSGFTCKGNDSDTLYEWKLTPTEQANPGNLRIVGGSTKHGNDRVEIAGTGTFDLAVKVTFSCLQSGKFLIPHTVRCVRNASVRFTQ